MRPGSASRSAAAVASQRCMAERKAERTCVSIMLLPIDAMEGRRGRVLYISPAILISSVVNSTAAEPDGGKCRKNIRYFVRATNGTRDVRLSFLDIRRINFLKLL